MKNVSIKFCSAEEARRRAIKYNIEEHMPNDSIFGIDEEFYETFNDRPCTITDIGTVVTLEFDDEKDEGYIWFVPKLFLDITEI